MSECQTAVSIRNVSKIYRLYSSLTEQALDIFGLTKLRFWRKPIFSEHWALNNISLEIKCGERIGILGRNGAGKTTLLKLITGNFLPTSGKVVVNGSVQALMRVGIGFHPEFTGYENVRSSLAYNGLSEKDLDVALDDVVNFIELGDFLHQPMKTYSMGMQARVMFAAATAIRPNILIVDEVLSAGDAYFSAKCAHRMEQLAFSGCTLLLVSHSMQQVLQFCQKAIWVEQGKIVMEGDALSVVKAYEEFTANLEWEASKNSTEKKSILDNKELCEQLLKRTVAGRDQMPQSFEAEHISPGGVSRWSGEKGLKVSAVRVRNEDKKQTGILRSGESAELEMEIVAEEDGLYKCKYHFYIFTAQGTPLTRHCSEEDSFFLSKGNIRRIRMSYPKVLFGNGEYIFTAGVYKHLDLFNLQSAIRYDLLTRSFEFKVVDVHRDDTSLFHHPCVWEFDCNAGESL
jgi:lipopolysaccharide transport system ATP-binding protein